MPSSKVLSAEHLQMLESERRDNAVAITSTARYTTAMPSNTHRNAVVTVIAAVIWKKAANTPMIRAAMIAATVQLHLQLQLQVTILNLFTSHHTI